eukprot:TRINITY_DN791_c0_g1_i2.p3 TRINITY_DN791_c0_g1~~TRINITY_DN791_c0_g1_i2.p3  ORF type:complete len:113 (-),score=39.10 TRINITY_DN791_c0_g1_i2:26-364(-)
MANPPLHASLDYGTDQRAKHSFPLEDVHVLNQWFLDHRALHDAAPYPTREEKLELAARTHLTLAQVGSWFSNRRVRYKHECTLAAIRRRRLHDDLEDYQDYDSAEEAVAGTV